MIKLYVADISPLMNNPELYATCYELSRVERREKADMRKCPPDKARCIGAGLLLQYAYGQVAGEISDGEENAPIKDGSLSQAVPVFVSVETLMADSLGGMSMPPEKKGVNGKPCWELLPEQVRLHFNLSHSGHMAACIIADKEVGLDIQRICRIRESVVHKCFSPEEEALLEGKDADRVFTMLWCRKEAAAKLTGRGLAQILETASGGENSGSANVSVVSHWIDEEYALSYAYCEKIHAFVPSVAG